MAKILEFRPSEPGCEDRTSTDCGHTTAEVIVFPGIRYDHQAVSGEVDSEGVAVQEPRRQRDILELTD